MDRPKRSFDDYIQDLIAVKFSAEFIRMRFSSSTIRLNPLVLSFSCYKKEKIMKKRNKERRREKKTNAHMRAELNGAGIDILIYTYE